MKQSYQTHFFIAIALPENLRQLLKQYERKYKDEIVFKKWVHQEDYHITLAFLGFVPEPILNKVKNRIREVVSNILPFSLEVTKFSTFGMKEKPRIFWLGVNKSEQLMQLQREIACICVDEGIKIENRPYTPHITVAKKWDGNHQFSIEEANKRLMIDSKIFNVEEIVLFQSHLGQSPMYERIETFYLN